MDNSRTGRQNKGQGGADATARPTNASRKKTKCPSQKKNTSIECFEVNSLTGPNNKSHLAHHSRASEDMVRQFAASKSTPKRQPLCDAVNCQADTTTYGPMTTIEIGTQGR